MKNLMKLLRALVAGMILMCATAPLPGVLADFPKPFLRIDYIYAAGNRLKPVSFEIISGDYHRPFVWHGRSFSAFPSDHAAVLAHFAVDTRGERLQRKADK